jgi:acetyl-CoA carboxylase biotin carboxyl carrier protein
MKVKLKKAAALAPTVVHTVAAAAPAAAPAAAAPAAAPAAPAEDANWKKIISPIPGTVYLKPNPDAQNFVGSAPRSTRPRWSA